tara:strand:- start:8350 stop:8688 length:339 start_codon:yes stop_codon:yes gene_type:complete
MKTTLSRGTSRSNTLARKRLLEIRTYLASVSAIQHSIYVNTGCRTEISCIYDWLSGVRCPDGRVKGLFPPTRFHINEWMSSFDEVIPSKYGDFSEYWWWTPARLRENEAEVE